jgi:hypothetical protein
MSDAKNSPSGTPGKEGEKYFHSYYSTHRNELSQKRRRRYRTDPQYQEEVKRRAMERYREQREAKSKEKERILVQVDDFNIKIAALRKELIPLRAKPVPSSSDIEKITKIENEMSFFRREVESRLKMAEPGVRGFNRPRVMQVDGQDVLVHCVSEFAHRVGRDVQTITAWEADNIIPPPTVTDEMGRRWYSEPHMVLLSGVAEKFRSDGGRNLADFKGLVAKEWKKRKGEVQV